MVIFAGHRCPLLFLKISTVDDGLVAPGVTLFSYFTPLGRRASICNEVLGLVSAG